MEKLRRLDHFGGSHVWSIIVYVFFILSLMFVAYFFWLNNRTHASLSEDEDEDEDEDRV